jgi:hypothetical protein
MDKKDNIAVMGLTWAIAKYSTATDATFIPKLTNIAASVDIPSIRAINRGPISLQVKSIRLICAFITILRLAKYNMTALTD